MTETMLNSFDIWTAALGLKSKGRSKSVDNISAFGIEKLRELILQLAVRGKLVPQDPNDEPASVLLERIKAEKERLIREGDIKAQKPLPEITDEEKPFELPEGWEWVRLGNLFADIHYGFTASADHKIRNVRLLRITDIQEDKVNWDLVPGCSIDENKIPYYRLVNGDILIARTGGTIGKSYLVNNIDVIAVFASYLIRLKYIPNMLPDFIKVFLGSYLYWNQLYENSMGTGQPNVNGNALKNLRVPLPPLAEQYRIVAKVDELMALCDRLEEEQTTSIKTHYTLVDTALDTLTSAVGARDFKVAWQRIAGHFDTLFTTEHSIDRLKQTILQLAVMGKLVPQNPRDEPASVLLEKIRSEKEKLVKEGKIKAQKPLPEITEEEKPFELPEGWEWVRLQRLVSILGDGLHGTPVYSYGTNYYFVNGNNLNDGRIEIKPNTKTVSREEFHKYKKDLSSNTLLISINGTLGKVGFYNSEKIILGKSACYFNLTDHTNKFFIRKVLESSYFLNYALSKATGSTIKNLSLKAMNYFPILLPPINEQHRIVARVDELMALCDTLKKHMTKVGEIERIASVIVEKIIEQVDLKKL